MRVLQYLKFAPMLSKHIDIFVIIFEEIASFVVVFAICIATFATSFYMLGRNQIQFDEIDDSEDTPPHHTFFGSIWSVWHMCLGNPEIDQFFVGNQGQAPYLTPIPASLFNFSASLSISALTFSKSILNLWFSLSCNSLCNLTSYSSSYKSS